MKNKTIGFLGGGNMATAILAGLVKNGHPSNQLIVVDHNADKLDHLKTVYGASTTSKAHTVIEHSDVLLLCVKPQHIDALLSDTCHLIQKKKPLVISIAAGLRIEHLDTALNNEVTIIRAMPNTPALIGCGMTGLFTNTNTLPADRETATAIFNSTGKTVWLEQETTFDALTVVSGCGPAYLFLVIEAISEAGHALGLSEELATQLATETMYGAGKMAATSNESARALRVKVTSKKGVTEKAIQTLEDGGIKTLFKKALTDGLERAQSLNK